MFHLWCEDIHRKEVTSDEHVIQKKPRWLHKHFNSHDVKDSRMFASGVWSAVLGGEGKGRGETLSRGPGEAHGASLGRVKNTNQPWPAGLSG